MRVSGNDYRVHAAGSRQELDGADQLISDLAALVDAGVVVVHEHILGPPRYGIAPVADHGSGRRDPRSSELRRHHATLT
ncbi:MAG: hypothetical protein ACTHMY_12095 [Solirubrobacteraceae bacterium]